MKSGDKLVEERVLNLKNIKFEEEGYPFFEIDDKKYYVFLDLEDYGKAQVGGAWVYQNRGDLVIDGYKKNEEWLLKLRNYKRAPEPHQEPDGSYIPEGDVVIIVISEGVGVYFDSGLNSDNFLDKWLYFEDSFWGDADSKLLNADFSMVSKKDFENYEQALEDSGREELLIPVKSIEKVRVRCDELSDEDFSKVGEDSGDSEHYVG